MDSLEFQYNLWVVLRRSTGFKADQYQIFFLINCFCEIVGAWLWVLVGINPGYVSLESPVGKNVKLESFQLEGSKLESFFISC